MTFLIALAIRLHAVVSSDIWYDEAYSLHVASLPIAEILRIRDYTPPLWEIILHPFVALAPSVITIRLVTLTFSMLAMIIAWRITKELDYTPVQTTVSMLMIAVLPGIIWYSSDGRSYAMLACLFMAGVLCVLRKNNILLFCICAVMLYTHVTAAFLVATLFFYAFILGADARKLAVMGVALALVWSPWIYAITQIVSTGGNPFSTVSTVDQFAASFWIGSTPAIFLVGMALILVTIIGDHKAAALTLLPVILMELGTLLTHFNLITYRTISPTLIPFALLVGRIRNQFVQVAWLITFVACVCTYNFQVKGSTQAETAQRLTGHRIVYATLTVALPFDYYLHDPSACILQLNPDGALLGDYSFGFKRCTLDQLTDYYLILPNDPIIPTKAHQQMQAIASAGVLVDTLHYLQISPVNIYLITQ